MQLIKVVLIYVKLVERNIFQWFSKTGFFTSYSRNSSGFFKTAFYITPVFCNSIRYRAGTPSLKLPGELG